jgi:hypothetical protein
VSHEHTDGERLTNVTITLPERLLREARHLAVDEGLSLSRFVVRSLEARVLASRRYRTARDRERQVLETGFDLGTEGRIDWTRDSLHER